MNPSIREFLIIALSGHGEFQKHHFFKPKIGEHIRTLPDDCGHSVSEVTIADSDVEHDGFLIVPFHIHGDPGREFKDAVKRYQVLEGMCSVVVFDGHYITHHLATGNSLELKAGVWHAMVFSEKCKFLVEKPTRFQPAEWEPETEKLIEDT